MRFCAIALMALRLSITDSRIVPIGQGPAPRGPPTRLRATMFGECFHKAAHDQLARRLPGADWYALVPGSTDPRAVPVVPVRALGLLDSLTHAREIVLVSQPFSRYLNNVEDDMWDGQTLQYAAEDYEDIMGPLLDAPSPWLVAVTLAALRRLAVEVGREWVAAGFGGEELVALWSDLTANRQHRELSVDRFQSLWFCDSEDLELPVMPTEPYAPWAEGIDGFEAVKWFAYVIADLANHAEDTYGFSFVVLRPIL